MARSPNGAYWRRRGGASKISDGGRGSRCCGDGGCGLAPYEVAFVKDASCPSGKVLKVTGAIRGPGAFGVWRPGPLEVLGV
ncbi:hypothetical protein IVB18_13670 [Bradyrhizobium sp. 186]|uniref:hypothetical protein n=1 Tax=Bradyrhizobium sp. 186 TaxID=2782654 RepID=UPI0020007188|nr:hypothetical protein [Bradyrhizobium sp. 186]UPK40761.1 hypothetical protein IVB18_13670 [Bradyrhizobium sp. 186]